jgi:hypothetical protein
MGQIVRPTRAVIHYENGAVQQVDFVKGTKRFTWKLTLADAAGKGLYMAMGETEEVDGVSAGIHQAMVAAAAIFSQVDQDVLEGGSDRA